jgi:phosphoglycerate dehydrogenase-like enzyme
MRVLVQIPQALARVAEEFPDVEAIDISADDPPPGTSADAFFGGWGDWDRVVRIVRDTGVSWFQLSGTGIDGVPKALFDEVPLVTCARGASSVPISEYVVAAMLGFEKQLPGNWLVGPPKHWNFQRMDSIAGKTLGLVGLGGIGARIALWASGGTRRRGARWTGSSSRRRWRRYCPRPTTWFWRCRRRRTPNVCSTPMRSPA